jgi:hypothetical protein
MDGKIQTAAVEQAEQRAPAATPLQVWGQTWGQWTGHTCLMCGQRIYTDESYVVKDGCDFSVTLHTRCQAVRRQ